MHMIYWLSLASAAFIGLLCFSVENVSHRARKPGVEG